jgi:curved DNA-binding protein
MDYKDYYKILGIARTASQDEIRSAYRKLAREYHPDHNPGNKQAEDKFKEINEAYQVLSDPQKRGRYDQLGDSYSSWQQNGTPGGFDWSQWYSSSPGSTRVNYEGNMDDLFGQGSFSDFFRTIFGGMAAQQAARNQAAQAPVYEAPVTISLEEAYKGAVRQVEGGKRKVQVRIPTGVKTGSKVRMPGGAPDGGDIYLKVHVADDPRFTREGNDLHTQTNVDVFTAMLGGEVSVPTFSGNVILKIPAGTQPDQVFRVSGRGMPFLKNPESRGDLYIRVKVNIPRNLTDEQKKLLQDAAKMLQKA